MSPRSNRITGATCAAAAFAVAALAVAVIPAFAGPQTDAALRQAAAHRRALRYDAALTTLEAALPAARGDDRARILIAHAAIETNPENARQLLLQAGRDATTGEVRRRADLEIARLDLARGSYRGVQTRLSPYAADPEAALVLGLAAVGLAEPERLDALLAPASDEDLALLLRGWAALQAGDPRLALDRLTPLTQRRSSDLLPTALLWKATAEAQLGDAAAAARTSAELRARFGAAPETDAAARAAQAPPVAAETAIRGQPLTLQVAAFADRANALRFRDGDAGAIAGVRIEAAESGGRTVYRVCVGRFDDRPAAEAFAAAELDPRGLAWQVVPAVAERR